MPRKRVFHLTKEKQPSVQRAGAILALAIWLVITSGSLASWSRITSTVEAAHTISLGTTGEDYFLKALLCVVFVQENKAQVWEDLSLAAHAEAS